MYPFEYREEAIDLLYSQDFKLPAGPRFIGTMNTADRSIRCLDIALRRRFDVYTLRPDLRALERDHAVNAINVNATNVSWRAEDTMDPVEAASSLCGMVDEAEFGHNACVIAAPCPPEISSAKPYSDGRLKISRCPSRDPLRSARMSTLQSSQPSAPCCLSVACRSSILSLSRPMALVRISVRYSQGLGISLTIVRENPWCRLNLRCFSRPAGGNVSRA